MSLLASCVCGSVSFTSKIINDIPCAECSRCGVIRQIVEKSPTEYANWYQEGYHGREHDHDFDHDLKIADLRIGIEGFKKDQRVLDVGSGNGAHIKAARAKEVLAYGCELVRGVDRTGFSYNKQLEDVFFPVDYFDHVTLHDVLEHFIDPKDKLKEVFRITKQEGSAWIDFPDFFSDAGKHHWRPVQHLWMFTKEQLEDILKEVGFSIVKFHATIPGKLFIEAIKPIQKRTTFSLLPGVGDIYWALTKLKGWTDRNGIADVYVGDLELGRKRAESFVHMFPFVSFKGYHTHDPHDTFWHEGYSQDGRTIFPNSFGCDYFMAYNGILRWDKSLDEVDLDLGTCSFPNMFEPIEASNFAGDFLREHGPYYVAFFSSDGMFQQWIAEFGFNKIGSALKKIYKETGRKIVLIGAHWNKNDFNSYMMQNQIEGFVNMTDQTTMEEVIALMRKSEGMIGFPSGLTILNTVLRKPTLIIWNNYFRERFWWTACPLQARNSWYETVGTKNLDADNLTKMFVNLCRKVNKDKPEKVKPKPSGAPLTIPEKLTVACVLKKGGDYDEDYVIKLKHMVEKNLTIPFSFVCLTDCDRIEGANTIPLIANLPGWWSKMELFRPGLLSGRVLFFDLDTIILGNIDTLAMFPHRFSMISDLKISSNFASGVMAWEGDFSFLYNKVKANPDLFVYLPGSQKKKLAMDQTFISAEIQGKGIKPEIIQRMVSVKSFKLDRLTAKPQDTSIVCFHGLPRPREAARTSTWVQEFWK